MFHYTNIVKVKVSDKSESCEDGIRKCLDEMTVEEVEYFDDNKDPDAIEIVITGRFKKDAFKHYLDGDPEPNPIKDRFDDAKPF